MSETYYLDIDDVLRIHARQIEQFGGAEGLRDAGLIEAALMRPQSGYYSDIIEEAASLWESLTMNHGFVDGNKRVGLACTYAFLGANDIKITASPPALIDFIYSNLEAGTFTKDILNGWLRGNTSRR
ncbi:MAG: type II toxin-antitoxin system death-on-curing family toxin [Pseudomonadota bacterium]